MTRTPLRVVQWTTGNISREAVKAILGRPDLELVGVYAFSAEKVGKDLGELCGLDVLTGVQATNDIDDIVALAPDCVLYMPLHPDVDHLVTLLQAGINVATTAHFMTGRAYGEEAKARLEEAAIAGGASMFGSGINPGYAQHLAATASNICRTARYVRIVESFDIGMWAGDANQDELGWGRPAGDPGHAKDIEHATIPFGDTCEALGTMFGVTIDNVRCEVEFAHATKDVEVPGRDVQAGSVAGIYSRWIGSVAGVDAVETAVRWTVSPEIEPVWDIAMAYQMEVQGDPNVSLRAEVLPDFGTMSMDDMTAMGSVITAMPVVNALHGVVAARPGIVGYNDLPNVATRLVPAAPKPPAPKSSRFTRESTLRDLKKTRVGRALNKVVVSQARKTASTPNEAALFAGMAGYMTLSKLSTMSDGKLTPGMLDSIVDLANGEPRKVATRVGKAGRRTVRRGVAKVRGV